MCMSPHEMTSERLEQQVIEWEDWANKCLERGDTSGARYSQAKADAMKAELKRRAEDGSYVSDTDPATGDKRF